MPPPMKQKPAEKTQSLAFSVKPGDGGVMPSVTQLLDRKTLEKQAVKAPPPSDEMPQELSFVLEAPPSESGESQQSPSSDAVLEMPTLTPARGFELTPAAAPATPATPAIPSAELAPPMQFTTVLESSPVAESSSSQEGGLSIALELPAELSATPESHRVVSDPTPSSRMPEIRPIARKSRAEIPLERWDMLSIKRDTSAPAQGLNALLSSGATQGLSLRLSEAAQGPRPPKFASSDAFGAGKREALWTGIQFDPAIATDAWSVLSAAGWTEIPPATTHTSTGAGYRNVLRTAFGARSDEWITLVRVGSLQSPDAILVLFSADSIKKAVSESAHLLYKPARTSTSAAA